MKSFTDLVIDIEHDVMRIEDYLKAEPPDIQSIHLLAVDMVKNIEDYENGVNGS